MPENEEYKIFCREVYSRTYEETYATELGNRTTAAAQQTARLNAQRKAIDTALVEGILRFSPEIPEDEIWGAIGAAHKINVANLSELGISEDYQEPVINRSVSAHQSWIKSSGHSFERYISDINNEDLRRNEIRFILQSELTEMIREHRLANTPEDINGLNAWKKDFDLYAIQSVHGEVRVFGCIQSKTSIRDRVGRDITFSGNAMDGLFWSAAVVLDGSFLNMPEFVHMVNGGGSYTTNGWHGMYAMSGIQESNGRIYKVDKDLNLFVSHAVAAARQFISDRRMLNHNWKA